MSTEVAKVDQVKIELLKPINDENNVRALLAQYRKAFEVAAVKHLDVDRLLRVALMTVSRSSALLECTAASLLGSVMLSAQLGLDIAAREAYLVPFKNKYGKRECQLIPDYRGIMKLVRQSGMVSNFRARCVYRQDKLDIEEGLNPRLVHVQSYEHDFKDEDLIGVYTVADFCGPDGAPSGLKDFQFMPIGAIKRIRARSKASNDGPWVTDFAEMAMKTGIKHHAKTLPQNIQIATALQLDDRATMARPQKIQMFEENGLTTIGIDPVEDRDDAPERARGVVDINSLKAGSEENRGHGNDNLDQVGKDAGKPETKTDKTETLDQKRARQTAEAETKKTSPEKAAASDGADPEAALTQEQQEQLETVRLNQNVEPRTWNTWIRKAFDIKLSSHLRQKHFPRCLAWCEAGGQEQQDAQ
jgi:recombination protein RecT